MNAVPPPPPYEPEKPANYQQAAPIPATQTVIIAAPVAIVGDYPIQCVCPHCHQQIVTRTEKNSGLLAWIICGILFIFGFWLCCFIPFCVDACKDTEHYCPHCSVLLGCSKRL